MADKGVTVRMELPKPDHARAKAAAALAEQDLKDYAAQAVMERVARDEAARQRPADPQTEGGE